MPGCIHNKVNLRTHEKFFSCVLFYCRKLPPFVESSHHLLLKRAAGANVRLLFLPYPCLFAFSGYFLRLCLSYTQSHFSTWVYNPISVSLYPKVFSVLGIHTAFSFSMPKVSSCPGYSYCFCFSYTQGFSLSWVFIRLFLSLCPNFYIHLRIMDAFPFTAPFLYPFML